MSKGITGVMAAQEGLAPKQPQLNKKLVKALESTTKDWLDNGPLTSDDLKFISDCLGLVVQIQGDSANQQALRRLISPGTSLRH